VAAKNALVGLELMAAQRPRLIVLDLHMPGLDGASFLDELHARPEWRAIPVLVVSAATRIEAPGAQGVLAKPFDLGELLQRVRELLPAF
jgi:CheY-like chemotaxis protein